jgi:OOP family OmpA-OmpF porin
MTSAKPNDGDKSPARPAGLGEAHSADLGDLARSVDDDRLRLTRIEERLANPEMHTRAVSRVLPQAIALRSQDKALVDAIEPTIESALRSTVRHHPNVIADALYPILGPAIRKSIFNALNATFQRLNRARERTFTFRSMVWRVEALRTHRSFEEVALAKSLVFRVEQAFLIHRDTGLLLQHAVARGVIVKDADIVSGMLSAIQDFVRDSFQTGGGDTLQLMRVGEVTVALEQGPLAVLAVVVRGVPPAELRGPLQGVVERIHAETGEELTCFRGDTSPFVVVRSMLESCLIEERRVFASRISISKIVSLLVLTVAVLFVVRYFAVLAIVRGERNRLVTAFEREPGYALLSTRIDLVDRNIHLHAMRDPRARDWHAVMKEADIDAMDVVTHWTLFESLDPTLLLERAKDILAPPPTVELSIEDGVLHARGTAPHRWTTRASAIAVAMPGIREFDAKELSDPLLDEALRLKRAIETAVVPVGYGIGRGDARVPSEALKGQLKELDRVARDADLFVRIRVILTAHDSESEAARLRVVREVCDEIQSLALTRVQCSALVSPKSDAGGEFESRSVNLSVDLLEAATLLDSDR